MDDVCCAAPAESHLAVPNRHKESRHVHNSSTRVEECLLRWLTVIEAGGGRSDSDELLEGLGVFGISEGLLVIAARDDNVEFAPHLANGMRKYLVGSTGKARYAGHSVIDSPEDRLDAIPYEAEAGCRDVLVAGNPDERHSSPW